MSDVGGTSAGRANGSAMSAAAGGGAVTNSDMPMNTGAMANGLAASTAAVAVAAAVAVYPKAERFEKLTSTHDVIGRHDNKNEEN